MLIDHVDARVRNLTRVRPLYDALLPAMGYSEINADEESAGYHIPGESGAQAFIWFAQDAAHQPNGTRIAFAAGTRADVDRFSAIAKQHGASNYEAPQLIREYGPAYYASFFEDAEGNKLEICCRRPE
jgi:hypothetical protein